MSHLSQFSKNKAALLGGFILLLSVCHSLRAQVPAGAAQDRAELLRTPVTLRDDSTENQTGTDSAHAIASPNDPDLGEQAILKRAENYQAFTVFASLPVSYTSNVALVRSGEQSDVLFTPSFGMSYTPRITKTLYLDVGFAQQFFLYHDFDGLNFASLDVRAGLVYTLPQWHNLLLRATYDFNRLSAEDLGREIFVNHALIVGAELPFRIGRAQQVSVGVDLDFSLAADPSPPARHDYSFFVGYSANLTRDLTVSAVGRLAVRDYVEGGRTDVSEIFALSASYRFNKWLSANAVTTFANNDSNQGVFDYTVFNLGGALSFTARF